MLICTNHCHVESFWLTRCRALQLLCSVLGRECCLLQQIICFPICHATMLHATMFHDTMFHAMVSLLDDFEFSCLEHFSYWHLNMKLSFLLCAADFDIHLIFIF